MVASHSRNLGTSIIREQKEKLAVSDYLFEEE
jgi:hypothetical protein